MLSNPIFWAFMLIVVAPGLATIATNACCPKLEDYKLLAEVGSSTSQLAATAKVKLEQQNNEGEVTDGR